MGLLSSILPGFRELRTPLAAGYLWLTVAWLGFASSIPEQYRRGTEHRRGSYLHQAIDRVWTHTGHTDKAVILTFAAFVVGASIGPSSASWINALYSYVEKRIRRSVSMWVWRAVMGRPAGQKAMECELDHWIRGWLLTNPTAWPLATEKAPPDPEPREAKLTRESEEIRQALLRSSELESLQTALLVQAPPLASKIDRLNAEGEFRTALALPFMALGVVIAWRGDIDGWSQVGVLVLACVLTAQMLGSGMRRSRRAREQLVYLVTRGSLTVPRLEQAARHAAIEPRKYPVPHASGSAS